jgi:hypothetical protein
VTTPDTRRHAAADGPLAVGPRDLASLAIVVPAWSLALAFAAGLAIGVLACRIVIGRGRAAEPVAPVVAPTHSEAAGAAAIGEVADVPAVVAVPEADAPPAAEVEPLAAELKADAEAPPVEGRAEAEAEAVPAEAEQQPAHATAEPSPATAEAAAEAPKPAEPDAAAAVDDVVAELERRVKGRRTDADQDRPTGGRGGRRG